MKIKKVLLIGLMSINCVSAFISKQNNVNAMSIASLESLITYDENVSLGNNLFDKGDFTHPFNGNLIPRSGDKYAGIYRGITSCNELESDTYTFYDSKNDNTFARLANYNSTNSERTRLSMYYYDALTNKPKNLVNTDYVNVSFSYRLYASSLDRLKINDDTVILKFQTRGSANGKTCEVYARSLIINEEGDESWHTYSYRVSTTYSMTTEYAWFYFYYHDFAPSMNPTYYIDLDNVKVSLDDGVNTMIDQGTFDNLANKENKLPTNTSKDEIYSNLFYRQDYGISSVQEKSYLRMNGDGNKSTFSINVNQELKEDIIRLSFDYKNLSYYNKPLLSLMLNAKNGLVLEDVLSNLSMVEDKYIYYSQVKNFEWNKFVAYLDVSTLDLSSIDFLLECDCDLAIDNLTVDEFIGIDITSGNYDAFKVYYDEVKKELGVNYKERYTSSSLLEIEKALLIAQEITNNSSQNRIDEAKELLASALEKAVLKGDKTKLYAYIDQIFDEMAGTNKEDYEVKSYVLFRYALENAIHLSNEATQEEIDIALTGLKTAYQNLVRKEN